MRRQLGRWVVLSHKRPSKNVFDDKKTGGVMWLALAQQKRIYINIQYRCQVDKIVKGELPVVLWREDVSQSLLERIELINKNIEIHIK